MLVGGVAGHEVHQDLQAAGMGLGHQLSQVLLGAVVGPDAEVVDDLVAEVVGDRRVDRREPERRHPQVREVVQPGGDRPEGRRAEEPGHDAVDDGGVDPGRVLGHGVGDAGSAVLDDDADAGGVLPALHVLDRQVIGVFSVGGGGEYGERSGSVSGGEDGVDALVRRAQRPSHDARDVELAGRTARAIEDDQVALDPRRDAGGRSRRQPAPVDHRIGCQLAAVRQDRDRDDLVLAGVEPDPRREGIAVPPGRHVHAVDPQDDLRLRRATGAGSTQLLLPGPDVAAPQVERDHRFCLRRRLLGD
jgi:hypothetical protein